MMSLSDDKQAYIIDAFNTKARYLDDIFNINNEPRSDKRDLLAIKVKSEIFTEKERPSHCEHLQKI